MKYIKNWAIALDQYVNAVTGGDPDETISSRLGKVLQTGECKVCKGFASIVCGFLNLFDKNHCIKSIDPSSGDDDLLR